MMRPGVNLGRDLGMIVQALRSVGEMVDGEGVFMR